MLPLGTRDSPYRAWPGAHGHVNSRKLLVKCEERRSTGRRCHGTMPTVLVVDDEAPMLQSMRYFLEREGYRVVTAENGTVALRAAGQEHPDLVILDIMLPDIDGLE